MNTTREVHSPNSPMLNQCDILELVKEDDITTTPSIIRHKPTNIRRTDRGVSYAAYAYHGCLDDHDGDAVLLDDFCPQRPEGQKLSVVGWTFQPPWKPNGTHQPTINATHASPPLCLLALRISMGCRAGDPPAKVFLRLGRGKMQLELQSLRSDCLTQQEAEFVLKNDAPSEFGSHDAAMAGKRIYAACHFPASSPSFLSGTKRIILADIADLQHSRGVEE
ncbi:hypothetical protein BKA70DRAFT_1400836 [Coprinopsis sp. MPI-PUGE-AT-0042]|nr:hypothetical protein BKA70DRAFT_1400836 [Coprinopsis sp. MPI-PUGE-AT-0042]